VSRHWISIEGGTPLNTINRRNRARCPACGVVESMGKIERQSYVGGQYIADIKVSRGVSGGASGTAIAANAVTGKGYEITVRFRDRSTTVLNEVSPRTWPLGNGDRSLECFEQLTAAAPITPRTERSAP
jgi:hypothetical protein